MTTLIPKFDLKDGGATPVGAVNRAINIKLAEMVSVKDFGATGDGTTDDATAIINALNSFGTNGGTLYFPEGTYIVGQAIPVRQGIHYLGESPLSTVLKASASSVDNILGYGYSTSAQIAAQNNFIVENLTFDGNKSARTENQLNLAGTITGTFVPFETVTSSSGGSATVGAVFGTSSITLTPISITGSFNVGNTVTGSTSGATFTIASKGADDAYQINIRIESGSSFRITNCKIINSFFTALSLYSNCVESTIDNNSFSNNNKSGTVVSSPYNIFVESYARNLNINSNLIVGGLGSGISVRGGTVSGMRITNNAIQQTANYGLELTAAVQAGNGNFTDTIVQGNRFYQAPNDSPDTITVLASGSGADIAGITISGNVFDTGQIGVGLRPTSSATINNVVISNNVFKDYTTYTAGIFASGATKVSCFGNQSNTSASFIDALQNVNSFQNLQATWFVGYGTPQGVVSAFQGSIYTNLTGGASTTLYVKETGAGTNTGWVAK